MERVIWAAWSCANVAPIPDSAFFGQPSVGMVDFRLPICSRVWAEGGFRYVVMWEGCDGLLKSSSQVMRGVKERHGAGEALKQPVYGGFHRISCVGLLWCWLVWSG